MNIQNVSPRIRSVRYFICEILEKTNPSMEMPCWCPLERHKYGLRKPTETSIFEFYYKCISPSLNELIKIKVIFILRQRTIRLQNLKNSVTLFLTQKSFLGCQVRCHVMQKPGNSSVLYHKTKNNPFEPKIRRNKGV